MMKVGRASVYVIISSNDIVRAFLSFRRAGFLSDEVGIDTVDRWI